MRLTVLGKSPAWQDAGGACSGYLVAHGDTHALVDCGNGVFAKLRERLDYFELDAVVISHLHADHFLDLVPFSYALTYTPRGPAGTPRPDLYVPPGGAATLRRVVGAWGGEDLIERAFRLHEYDPAETLAIGSLRLRFQAVPHYTETFAIELSAVGGGGRIVYGADSRPSDALDAFGREVDVMLLEATLPEPERAGHRGHLTPAEAGALARAAAARRLVLVHISDELDLERARDEAASAFGGPVEVAREGAVYEV